MAASIAQILDILEEIAPQSLKEDYDNVGLLAGHPAWKVKKALVALDLTEEVVREAVQKEVQLIITHHPIFFRGRKNIREDDPEGAAVCALIRAKIGLIAVHTNFDQAECGVNDALAEEMELFDVFPAPHGIRLGKISPGIKICEIGRWVESKLGGCSRVYAQDPERLVERIAVCGGSGGTFYETARYEGAQAFITGEISYHNAINAVMQGLCIIEAGHYETEHIAIKLLANGLQRRINELQYNIMVVESVSTPFWRFDG